MFSQWRRGVTMRSLAPMYSTTKDEIEGLLRDRVLMELPGRRAA
jgi:hypothetical protein